MCYIGSNFETVSVVMMTSGFTPVLMSLYFAVALLKIFNFEALYNHQYNIWFLALITTMEL